MRNLYFAALSLFFLVTIQYGAAGADGIAPRRQAHAHNDYLHPRPLLDALDQGFCSVEADVFLVEGKLLVAHTFLELKPENTLESLYLAPLRERIRQHDGFVHADRKPISLLIDFKSDGESTFAALNELLSHYKDVFAWSENGTLHPGPVVAIVSGNRPIQTMADASPRFAGIDGRLSDLDSPLSTDLMPLISDNWSQHFKWRGSGGFSAAENEKLTNLVKQIHERGRLVRFWGTADNPAMWRVLRDAGVDQINTDDLRGLSRFLESDDDVERANNPGTKSD